MGSLKFPHASGGSMSIASPATQPSTDLELKLPATIGTANQYLKNSSTAGTLEFGSLGATGKILQVVHGRLCDERESFTNPTSWTTLPDGLSITPSATSSKIFMLADFNWESNSNVGLILDFAKIIGGTTTHNLSGAAKGIVSNWSDNWRSASLSFVDSPSTTSTINYRLDFFLTANATMYWNDNGTDNYTHLTLVEIGA